MKKPNSKKIGLKFKHAKWTLQYSPPFILIFILLLLSVIDKNIQSQIKRNQVKDAPLSFSTNPMPILSSNNATISAEAAIILDDRSQASVFEKNKNLRFSMASTTKIMTALTALEYYNPKDILTVVDDKVGGAEVGFKQGQQLFFNDLIFAMLLPSGNDAAQAIADNYPGGKELFVKAMNDKAKRLNLHNTSFTDPTGLSGNNYTTVTDLARLASIAMKNKTFKEIVNTKNTLISDIYGNKYAISNLNKLLGSFGVTGIKTGFTEEAGEVLVTAREENDHMQIIVVMKSEDRFKDTTTLLSMLTSNLSYSDIYPQSKLTNSKSSLP